MGVVSVCGLLLGRSMAGASSVGNAFGLTIASGVLTFVILLLIGGRTGTTPGDGDGA
jgi:hypothetical protein